MLPQLIYLFFTAIGLGVALCDHGKLKKCGRCRENATPAIVATIVVYWLLWWGGFFDVVLEAL